MTKFESTVQQVHSPQVAVYNKLSNLNNLRSIQERAADPAFVEQIKASGQVPEDKIAKIQDALQRLELTADTITYPESPVGNVTLRIVERDEPKCIKFELQNAPIQGNLWIQILPTSTYESKLRCTIGAELNFLMKQVAKKPLQEGVEKLAQMLAMIPYGY